MAYEWRKGHLYYYQKEWSGGTCRSVYAGAAEREITRLAAQLDQLDRTRRELAKMDQEDEQARFVALSSAPPELAALECEAKRAVAAALQNAGYHQHKRGEWRKKRDRKNESDHAIVDRRATD